MTEENPGSSFAALMSGAAAQAAPPPPSGDPGAPFGYTTGKDGIRRPKKSPGRPRKTSPSLDELKGPPADPELPAGDAAAGEDAAPPAAEPPADRAPGGAPKGKQARRARPAAPVPAYKPGVITAGVNRLYRRAGKIVRAMDHDIGVAILESAANTAGTGEPDDSVGAAWDELAKTNPRIRRFLMKAIAGGAWGQLVMAHAPIAMAIVMKPAILRMIPFSAIIESMAEPDEDTPPGEGGLPAGLTQADAQQAMDLARRHMENLGFSISDEAMAAAAAMAGNGSGAAPPGYQRHQPRRPASRAQRKGG